MKTAMYFFTAAAILACLIVMAGCTGTPGSQPVPENTGKPVPLLTAESINATPVHYAEVNGVKLGYREFGSGEPLLLIEGFGSTMDSWNATFVGILASKYHVYTYDHRGMGYSSTDNATPAISQYADDAAGLIPALGYDSMNIYGVSMGSTTSQQLVIDHPERVRKLVLSSSTYSIRIPECSTLFAIIRTVNATPSEPQGVRDEAQANLAWNGSYNDLSGIHRNVMLIVGTSDALTPDPVSVQMAGQINGSWVVRFTGVPHEGERYAPVEYAGSIMNFFATNESPEISG